jgi:hypothetical protein
VGLLGVGEMGQALARVFAGQLIKNVAFLTSPYNIGRFLDILLKCGPFSGLGCQVVGMGQSPRERGRCLSSKQDMVQY